MIGDKFPYVLSELYVLNAYVLTEFIYMGFYRPKIGEFIAVRTKQGVRTKPCTY
jgi:hypothetical protein